MATLLQDENSSEYTIPLFMGMNQSQYNTQLNPGETIDAQNMVINNGDLEVAQGFSKYIATALPAGIKTLMVFFKNETDGTQTKTLLASTSDTIYKWSGSAWVSIKTGLTSGFFDFINYQKDMTDIIIMGNGKDATSKWDGTTFADLGGTPPKFKSITMNEERLWVVGDEQYPNTLYHTNVTDPEDWDYTVDKGAAFEDLPTWDNGVCIGVAMVMGEIVVFKTRNIFRVVQTYVGEYTHYNVFSTTGAIAERSIVNDRSLAFFLAKDGIYTYNGTSTILISEPIKDVIASMNKSYADKATGVFFDYKYILAIPTGSSTVNDTIIEYDTLKNNFIVKKGINVTSFLEYGDKLLFANDSSYYVYQYNTGIDYNGTLISAYWETPDTDWGVPNGKKTCSYIYFTGKGTGSIKIDAIFNNNGTIVTKSVTQALTTTDKVYKIRLKNKGRRFKFKFSNVTGSYFKISDVKIMIDVDED